MKRIIIIVLFGLLSCSFKPDIIHPVQTETKSGAVIEQIEAKRTGDRDNVPVGVNPRDVQMHIKTKTGAEVWIAQKKKLGLIPDEPEIYANPQARQEGLVIDRPAKTWKWLWILGAIAGGLIVADILMRNYLGFNLFGVVFGALYKAIKAILPKKEDV